MTGALLPALALLPAGMAGAATAALQVPPEPAPGAPAPDTTAVLTGLAFDSTTRGPLAGAWVAVAGTDLAVEAGADGRFRIEGVPAGERWVVLDHPRLRDLGVGSPVRLLRIEPGARIDILVAGPSTRTLRDAWCVQESVVPGTAAVAGFVRDRVTGVPVPRARVILEGRNLSVLEPRSGSLETHTDRSGHYRFCHLTAQRNATLQVRFGNASSEKVFVRTESGEAQLENVELHIAEEGRILGVVLDGVSGAPVEGALVALVGADQRRVTDEAGRFHLAGVAPGLQVVQTEHIAYGSRLDSVTVFSQETVESEIRLLPEAIPLAPLMVTARSRADLDLRARGTRFDGLTPEEVDEVLPRVVTTVDLLRAARIPGLTVREMTLSTGVVDVPGICVEGNRARRSSGIGQQCNMVSVYVDGARISDPEEFLSSMDPRTIQSIELLSPLDAGARFSGTDARNGVLLIQTRLRNPR